MHISIPDVEELQETKGNRTVPERYVSYNIHINGTYHCSARFSQMSRLHEKLKREFGAGCLEKFPPKKFFYLKPEECHERRFLLQKWFQKIAQQPRIVTGNTFQTFLLNAQKEVQKAEEALVQLEVYLVNGKKVAVDIMNIDQTDDVLETVANVLNLDENLTYYFGLYLVDDLDGKVVVRKLQDFESPYISLERAEEHQKIQLRKAYWSVDLDSVLWDNPVALNLLYIETIAEIKNGHILPRESDTEKLQELRSQRDRKSFLQLAREQPGYGYVQYGEAESNYPEYGARVFVSLGHVPSDPPMILFKDKTGGEEYKFFVRRIRCWRTYSTEEGVELEFEYLHENEEGQAIMKWIKIQGPSNIHLAMGLQFLVEEMLRVAADKPIKRPVDREGAFKPRRQTNAPPNMSFLTSDDGEGSSDSVRVVLSELLKKVNEEEEGYVNDILNFSDAAKAEIEAGLDFENEHDDPIASFADMVGL